MHWAPAVRLFGVLTLLLGGTWAVAAGAAQASQAGTAGAGWNVERTPNQDLASTSINELSAVSCTSGRACTAVGSHSASLSSPGFPLAERWNGTRWRIQPTILPSGAKSATLAGVSCASATACTAVGGTPGKTPDTSLSLAEAWNGTKWRVQATPVPKGSTSNSLFAVSCTSPDACTAVGNYRTAAGHTLAMAERWTGRSWRLQAVPKPASSAWFYGVSCATARACTAVGYYTGTGGTRPLAEAWDGTRWHIQAVPLPRASAGSSGGMLAAVSCTSPRACTATGANFSTTAPTLVERWNGKRWRIQPAPYPADSNTSHQQPELNAVSCTSATACTASGAYAPGGHSAYFLEAWNGLRWRLVTAPHPVGSTSGALNGMSCVPARCTAVGAWSGGPIFIATLAMAN